ncbi:toprim domain-containing protein [Larkinella insperata]|uniref:Toprim domain-containing protein n=1 Tax=Larkinella insperata TaxID=332158 RepID=A0ABW3QH25_9BACT
MTRFDELKEKFPNVIPVAELRANVSIIELAVQYGYQHLPYKGQTRPVLKHPADGDTIVIKNPTDASQQLYQRAGDFSDSGTIIDFVRNRLPTLFSVFNRPGQHEFRNITSVLYDYLSIDPEQVARNRKAVPLAPEQNAKQPFAKQLFDLRSLEKDNYLLKRNIDPKIIESPEFKGKIVTQVSYLNSSTGHAEDFLTVKAHPERKYFEFHNVAFPYYNGLTTEVMGLEVRNENLKMHAAGSDRYASVFTSNIPPKIERFVITESALDALAHKQLRSIRGDDAFNTVYFSTGGQLAPEQINTISRYISSLEKASDWKIELGFDNDPKGHRYDMLFVQQMAAPQFPTAATVAPANRLGLLLPDNEGMRTIQDALLARVELFNTNVRSEIEQVGTNDEATKKEVISQLINIGLVGKQTAIYVPETPQAMSIVSRYLLEYTGLDKRIAVEKSQNKDFCDELKMHMDTAKRFKYGILDESGNTLYNSGSAITVQRIMASLQSQNSTEGRSVTYRAVERLGDGWQKERATLEIKDGAVTKAVEHPEFKKQVSEERTERSQQIAIKQQAAQTEGNQPESTSFKLKHR